MTASTTTLRRLLQDRHPPPEWFLAFEVQVERDEGGLRFADAIAINTRKSAGFPIDGFELKVSRSDWLNELKNPTKATAARSLCDFWWLVVGDYGIVRSEEVPEGVGLMVAEPDGRLHTVLHPTRSTAPNRHTVSRAIVAAVLNRIDPMESRASYWENREREAERKGYAKGMNAAKRVNRKQDREELNLP